MKQIDKTQLEPSTFWDVNFEEFNPNEHVNFVIHRVAHRGSMKEFYYLIKTFSYQEILDVLLDFRGTDPMVINFYKQMIYASSK